MTDGAALFERLASILRKVDDASRDLVRVDALLLAFEATPDGPFEGAALFASSDGRSPFALRATRGCESQAIRGWKAWPFRRLFARMKPARIIDPGGSGRLALAVPLCHAESRLVVLAPVSDAATAPELDAFFSALESVTIPKAPFARSIADEIPLAPLEPAIVAFGLCRNLHDRLSRIVQSRGWTMIEPTTTAQLCDLVQERSPDLLILDTAELLHPVSTLRMLHRAAEQQLQLVAFETGQEIGLEAASLTDRVLPHDANDDLIFEALKSAITSGPIREQADLDRSRRSAHASMRDMASPRDLARFAAARAAEIMRGWAGVVLVSDAGGIYPAEFPLHDIPILSGIPSSFLNDSPTFSSRVDDGFIREIADDERGRAVLATLHPVSGATLPLVHGGRHLGVLVGCSQGRAPASTAFEALVDLSRIVARRFHDLTAGGVVIPEFKRQGAWERWRNRDFELAVYRSRDCTMPWRYRLLDPSRGLLTLNLLDDEPLYRRLSAPASREASLNVTRELAAHVDGPDRFVAVLDLSSASITYALRDFSPPLLLHTHGPSGAIGAAERVTAGVATLAGSDGALICDRRLWRWFDEERAAVEMLPAMLDERTPPGFASLVKIS